MTADQLTARGTDLCRACGSRSLRSVLDLGRQPLANRLLLRADDPDPTYPLHLKICTECALGQVGEFVTPDDIFGDYPYLSSTSAYWLDHVGRYALQMTQELSLVAGDLVVEVASNDGHLLREFLKNGNRVVGVEPAANIASAANDSDVPTLCAFFGRATADRLVDRHGLPRLVVANNVLAHVPDLHDFLSGLAALSGPDTVITVENPTLLNLLHQAQFDTIYHEHFSYLSVHSVQAAAAGHGLDLVRVEELPTHGGSNRYWLRQAGQQTPDGSVADQLAVERAGGLFEPDRWHAFAQTSGQAVADLRAWLVERETSGRTVVAYGAAAKGNTFLNAVGEAAATLEFVVDGSAEKQGRFLPGSHVPVVAPEVLAAAEVDDVLILPWNIGDELRSMVWELSPEAECWVALPTMTRLP